MTTFEDLWNAYVFRKRQELFQKDYNFLGKASDVSCSIVEDEINKLSLYDLMEDLAYQSRLEESYNNYA